MEEITNPHDKFFKQVMTDKEVAKDFVKNYLPKDILEIIDPETIQISKDSFIEPELKETFSDILYEINVKNNPAYIYFLIEHKSFPYPNIILQLLKYMTKIWELKSSQKKKNEKLPLIIPLVFYHGKQKWNIGLKISDILQEIPPVLEKFVPEFEYFLIDTSKYEEKDIVGQVRTRIFMEIMKNISLGNFPEKVKELFLLFEKLEKSATITDFFRTFILYIMNAGEDFTFESVKKIIKDISYERSEEMMTIAERLRYEGMHQGMQKGLLEGIEVILDIKFGQIGLKLMNRIKKFTDIEKLEEIKDLLRKAQRIEEIEKKLAN